MDICQQGTVAMAELLPCAKRVIYAVINNSLTTENKN
jgi:hypothetical protein